MGELMRRWQMVSATHRARLTGNPIMPYCAERAVDSLKVTFAPTQNGTGTPSSSNVRPVIAWSSVNVWIGGNNVFDMANTEIADQKIRNNSGVEVNDAYEAFTRTPIPVVPGSTVTISGLPNSTNTKRVYYLGHDMGWLFRDDHSRDKVKFTITIPADCSYIQLQLRRTEAVWSNVQVEYGSTATTFSAYSGTTFTASLGSTYYGGTLDLVSGVLSVNWGYIASYTGETLPGRWVSSKDPYTEGGTPTTGAAVAYELTTPQIIQLTGQTITAPIGKNVVCSTSQGVEFTYLTH